MNEEDSSLSYVNFRRSNSEHADINLQESIIVNNREDETTNISSSTSTSKGVLHCEKLISNLKSITKM